MQWGKGGSKECLCHEICKTACSPFPLPSSVPWELTLIHSHSYLRKKTILKKLQFCFLSTTNRFWNESIHLSEKVEFSEHLPCARHCVQQTAGTQQWSRLTDTLLLVTILPFAVWPSHLIFLSILLLSRQHSWEFLHACICSTHHSCSKVAADVLGNCPPSHLEVCLRSCRMFGSAVSWMGWVFQSLGKILVELAAVCARLRTIPCFLVTQSQSCAYVLLCPTLISVSPRTL